MIYQTVSEMENGKWFDQQQFPKLNAHTCWKGRRVGAVQHTAYEYSCPTVSYFYDLITLADGAVS